MRLLEDARKFSCKDRHERSYKGLVHQYKIYSSYASYHRLGSSMWQSRYREQKIIYSPNKRMVPFEQAITGMVLSIGLLPTHPAGTLKQELPPPGPNPSQI